MSSPARPCLKTRLLLYLHAAIHESDEGGHRLRCSLLTYSGSSSSLRVPSRPICSISGWSHRAPTDPRLSTRKVDRSTVKENEAAENAAPFIPRTAGHDGRAFDADRNHKVSDQSDRLDALVADVRARAAELRDLDAIDALKTEVLGRKGGSLSRVMAGLAKIPKDERAEFGRRANDAKRAIEEVLESARRRVEGASLGEALSHRYDVTFPATAPHVGGLHLLRQTLDAVVDFFRSR